MLGCLHSIYIHISKYFKLFPYFNTAISISVAYITIRIRCSWVLEHEKVPKSMNMFYCHLPLMPL